MNYMFRKKTKRFVTLLFLFLLVVITVFGPLVKNALAATTSGPPNNSTVDVTNGPVVNLNWVNECYISGSIIYTDQYGNQRTTNLVLNNANCIQNWDQNGIKSKNVVRSGHTYESNGNTCQNVSSQSYLKISAYVPAEIVTVGTLYYNLPGLNSSCGSIDLSSPGSGIHIGQPQNANIVFAIYGNSIVRVDNSSYFIFNQSSSNKNLYVLNSGGICSDRIYVNSQNNATLWNLQPSSGSGNNQLPANIEADGCSVSNDNTDIDGPAGATNNANCQTQSPSVLGSINPVNDSNFNNTCSYHPENANGSYPLNLGGSSNLVNITNPSASSSTPSCISGGAFAWLLCPIINALTGAETYIENLVSYALATPPIDLNPNACVDGSTGAGQNYTACIYNVWSEFRVFGNIVLVIALLVVVFAEAMGGGGFEAYEIRKILPRILLAAILINISIYLMAGLVDITNIIGKGIFGIITEPFKASGEYALHFNTSGGNFLFGTGGLMAIFTAGTFWLLFAHGGSAAIGDAIGFLVMFAIVPAVLALLGVLLTIFFRSILIVLLLMVSPVAFALYCLPNTEQYFHKWLNLLTKTLMVYPVVMVIFAMCDIGAVVVTTFTTITWLGDLLAIVAVTAPLFLVPFAFKFAGGTITAMHGAITNIANKAHAGMLGDPNDPYSMQNRTKRKFAVRRNDAGLTGSQLGTRINPRQIYSKDARERAKSRLSAQKQAGLETLRRQGQESPLWHIYQNDSEVNKVLAEHRSAGEARNALNNWRDTNLRGASDDQKELINKKYTSKMSAIAAAEKIGFNSATRRAALLNPNYIKFEAAEGEEGWNKAVGIMHDISGGDEFQFRSIMNEYRAQAKAAGRFDQLGNKEGNVSYDGQAAWNDESLYNIAQGSPKTVRGSSNYYAGVINRASAGTLEENGRDASFFAEAKRRGLNKPEDVKKIALNSAGIFYNELGVVGNAGSGIMRDEALAAQRRIRQMLDIATQPDGGIQTILNSEDVKQGTRNPSGPINQPNSNP